MEAQYITPIGARLNSMGNVSAAVSDHFSIFSNPSTLTFDMKNSANIFIDHRYNVSGLNTMAFAYNHSLKHSVVSTGISRFGDELLNHSRIEMAFAHKVRMVSLGGGIGLHQLVVSENGVARNLTFQFGGMVEITPKIYYGAHVYNMFRAKVAKESNVYYPVLMKTGFTYKPFSSFFISGEIEKDSRFDSNLKAGLEYKLVEWFVFRTGVNSSPSNGFFGVGWKLKELNLDYGISIHSRIGLVHFLGLAYVFRNNQELKKEESEK